MLLQVLWHPGQKQSGPRTADKCVMRSFVWLFCAARLNPGFTPYQLDGRVNWVNTSLHEGRDDITGWRRCCHVKKRQSGQTTDGSVCALGQELRHFQILKLICTPCFIQKPGKFSTSFFIFYLAK